MVTVSKATILENVHQTFYTLINSITNFTDNVYSAFPDLSLQAASSKTSYPIFILESPDVDTWGDFTMEKILIGGTIALEIYTTSAKTADEYGSDAFSKIEDSISSLRGDGLQFIEIESMDKDVVQRGKINVHIKTITWAFQFIFDKTTLPY